MEVGVICFNLARLTGVVYCGSLLPLMASNSSNGTHLLSFHPPSLPWWRWRNMKKTKHHLFVWNCRDAPVFSFGEDGCAVRFCVRLCEFRCTLFVLKWMGPQSHWDKQSVWCLRVILDYPVSVFVCEWTERTQTMAEPQQSANRRPMQTPSALSSAIDWGNQTSERKREVLVI